MKSKSLELQFQMVYLQIQRLLLKSIYKWNISEEQKKKAREIMKELGENYLEAMEYFQNNKEN